MSEANTIGARLRALRIDRGLTQEGLAELSGVSIHTIRPLEQDARTSTSLGTLTKLSDALDCEISELVDKRDKMGSDRDGGSVLALRDALLTPALLPGYEDGDGDDPMDVMDLQRQVRTSWEAYWGGRWGSELLAQLPLLLGEARRTHVALGTPAIEPLALVYDLASSLLTQIGRTDLAIVAAERAITVAHSGDDERLWAILHASYSWTLFHQGRYREAEEMVVRMAERTEPSFSNGDDFELALWGKLVLTAIAPTVAQDRDPGDYLRMAGAGAARLSRPVRLFQHTPFSAPCVDMQATYAYASLGKPGPALDAAGKIRPGDLTGISRGAHLMDVAQAHVHAGHWTAAESPLLEAREVSPTWFRHQRVARQAVGEMREHQRRLTPAVRSLARSLAM